MSDKRRKRVTQSSGILGAEVYLIGHAIESEGHGLVGVAAVEVILEHDIHALGHVLPFQLHDRVHST